MKIVTRIETAVRGASSSLEWEDIFIYLDDNTSQSLFEIFLKFQSLVHEGYQEYDNFMS